ncbi:MAG: AAA family ATPase [Planctomycetota bacterium]|jgi:ABC-type Mn2+/Zn2+ transport system ATPase subunit
MYLSRFGVKNYKCLGDIDVPLTPIHVLIGENDAGKTSLLEAMAAFCASPAKPLNDVFPEPWSGRELVSHASDEPSIDLSGEWSQAPAQDPTVRYGLGAVFPGEGKVCRTNGEWMRTNGDLRTLKPDSERSNVTALYHWKNGRNLPHGVEPGDLDAIAEVVRPAHLYALDPRLMALPVAIFPQRKFRLDPDGLGLSTLLDDVLGYDAQRFIDLRTKFCHYFKQFVSVRIESENALSRQYVPSGLHRSGESVGKAIYFQAPDGQSVRAQQASDGAILFLGLLALAHVPQPPSLLLLEEPENGVYPKRLEEVIKILREMSHQTEGVRFPQIILTTHSPYVLSFFEPEEVTFLSRPKDNPDGPVRARPLRDAPSIKEQMAEDAFYLGELWYNLTEEELFGEP